MVGILFLFVLVIWERNKATSSGRGLVEISDPLHKALTLTCLLGGPKVWRLVLYLYILPKSSLWPYDEKLEERDVIWHFWIGRLLFQEFCRGDKLFLLLACSTSSFLSFFFFLHRESRDLQSPLFWHPPHAKLVDSDLSISSYHIFPQMLFILVLLFFLSSCLHSSLFSNSFSPYLYKLNAVLLRVRAVCS